MSGAPGALCGGALALCLALAGCITTPLEDREWHAVRSQHFEVLSSLGRDETARLALDAERFRAAAAWVWGAGLPAAPQPTRLYAFDDRGVSRPFALDDQRSYLLARPGGDVIVLRTGEAWGDGARTELRLALARRLFANASPPPLPPWAEEGLAQLASTIEVRGAGATVGIPHSEHLARLRSSQWVPLERVLAARELSGWSSRERATFEAEAWALAHALRLAPARRDGADAALARYRALLGEATAPDSAAREAFGDDLQREVWAHVTARELPSFGLRIPATGRPRPEALPRRAVLAELGALALAIDEPALARRYYERAVEESDAPSAAAQSGLGLALAAQGDAEAAEARHRAALALAPDDPRVRLGWAHWLRARAESETETEARARRVEESREQYRRALELAPGSPEAHAGLAATHLVEGEDAAAGLPHLRAAQRLLPGDPSLARLRAELALATGDRAVARREAIGLLTRAHTAGERDAARALLERTAGETRAER